MKRIADSTVRRLSAYLRFLEDFETRGLTTISSEELANRGGTTSAQVRKDLSFFGSFGKRGLGYSVPELAGRLREILGLGREWRVVIVGAGKIGAALAQYRGFRQRGFTILAAYDNNPDKIGRTLEGIAVRDIAHLERDIQRDQPDIVVLTVPGEEAQERGRPGRARRGQGDSQLRPDPASRAGRRHREDGEHGDGARRA